MGIRTATFHLSAEQCEAIRLALGHWINDNEKCILDTMKDSAREERLDQLHYHVMLTSLYEHIYDKEMHIKDLDIVSEVLEAKNE